MEVCQGQLGKPKSTDPSLFGGSNAYSTSRRTLLRGSQRADGPRGTSLFAPTNFYSLSTPSFAPFSILLLLEFVALQHSRVPDAWRYISLTPLGATIPCSSLLQSRTPSSRTILLVLSLPNTSGIPGAIKPYPASTSPKRCGGEHSRRHITITGFHRCS